MWIYKQTGQFLLDADHSCATSGWAGNGSGKNNPSEEGRKGIGPLPKGYYIINAPGNNTKTGKYSLRLDPFPANKMLGRSAFYIHGAAVDPAYYGQESEGCIVIDFTWRQIVWNSGIHLLKVI